MAAPLKVMVKCRSTISTWMDILILRNKRMLRSQINNIEISPNQIPPRSLRPKGRGSTTPRRRRSFGNGSCLRSFSKKLAAASAPRATKSIQATTTHSRVFRPIFNNRNPARVCSKTVPSPVTAAAYRSKEKTPTAPRRSLP